MVARQALSCADCGSVYRYSGLVPDAGLPFHRNGLEPGLSGRVSSVWFTTRTRSVESITDEVSDLLQEKLIPFERGVKLAGRSGRDWSVDFQTRTVDRSALVCVLSSGSQAAARRIAEHICAEWYDLSLLKTGSQPTRFVSLFDDTIDIWGEEDFRLVESVSEICRWSRPDEFEHALRNAA